MATFAFYACTLSTVTGVPAQVSTCHCPGSSPGASQGDASQCWASQCHCSCIHPWSHYPTPLGYLACVDLTLTFLGCTSSPALFASPARQGRGLGKGSLLHQPDSSSVGESSCSLLHAHCRPSVFFSFVLDTLTTCVANSPCRRMARNCFKFQGDFSHT